MKILTLLLTLSLSSVAYGDKKLCVVEHTMFCFKGDCKPTSPEGDATYIDTERNLYALGNLKTEEFDKFPLDGVEVTNNYTTYNTKGLGAVLKIANSNLEPYPVKENEFIEFRSSNLFTFISSGTCQSMD